LDVQDFSRRFIKGTGVGDEEEVVEICVDGELGQAGAGMNVGGRASDVVAGFAFYEDEGGGDGDCRRVVEGARQVVESLYVIDLQCINS